MTIPESMRERVRQRAAGRCEYCHADERWQFIRFTIDHVMPISSGGGDGFENLALACRNCNERRGNRCEVTISNSTETVAVFDPRKHTWAEHFVWEADKVRIVGITEIGRGTVALLDLNDDRHGERVIRVRARDVFDGFHPPPGDPVKDQP